MGKSICITEGCEDPALIVSTGMCNKHRLRFAKYGTTELPRRLTTEEKFWARVEKTDSCWLWTGPVTARGRMVFYGGDGKNHDAVHTSYEMSRGHKITGRYRVQNTCGNDLCVCPEHLVWTPAERFWAKVDKTETCWNWVGNRNEDGYGIFTIGAKDKVTVGAHRWSYRQAYGDIHKGMMIDHECRNTSCVNPSHLRIATRKQNAEHQQTTNRKSASGIRGVFPKDGQWRAGVRHNRKMIYAGYFRDINDAAEAARQLRIKLYTHNNEDRKDVA